MVGQAADIARRDGTRCAGQQSTFAVRAHADPQILLRILGLFAQRSVIPEQASCARAGDILLIDIQASLPDEATAELLLHKLRAMVCVDRACLIESPSW